MEITKTYNSYWQRWEWENSQGQYHREDGPAVECNNGTKYWYQNGQLHREDGPAQIYNNGDKIWYQNNLLHREDGPAVELTNGHTEYWIGGIWIDGVKILSEEEEIARLENESNLI